MRIALGCLASGSSGNSYLIKTDTTAVLVDAGLSGKQIFERLEAFGVGDAPAGVLVTHEHSDHIKGLPVLMKKKVPVYANESTARAVSDGRFSSGAFVRFATGDSFWVGDIRVSSFPVSHDAADPVGFSFEKDGACISIVTDTGVVTEACREYMKKADILVLESNHDESMLRIGRYPWFLKQRILGEEGHLSNEAAAKAVAKMLEEEAQRDEKKYRKLLLAHLSRENNFPQMALATMENVLEDRGFVPGRDISVETLSRTEISSLYVL